MTHPGGGVASFTMLLCMATLKTCKMCGTAKDEDEFYLTWNKRTRNAVCKACYNARQRDRAARYATEYVGPGVDFKRCPSCGARKPADQFGVNRLRKSGLEVRCKDCRAEQARGLGRGEYERRLAEQGGRCVFCLEPPPDGVRLYIDHDHATGAVRGLLCRDHNLALGIFRDDVNALRRAIEYLGGSSG